MKVECTIVIGGMTWLGIIGIWILGWLRRIVYARTQNGDVYLEISGEPIREPGKMLGMFRGEDSSGKEGTREKKIGR